MSRILLLYATREGQTAKVARRIAAQLRDAGEDVTLLDAEDSTATAQLDLDRFDRLVFGASMHAGGLEKELVQFINGHRERIRSTSRFLFVVLLSAAAKDAAIREQWLADARRKIGEQLDVTFDDIEMIAGALRYSKYPLPLKWLMRRIARQAGEDTDTGRDYEYTDWSQVARYAARLSAG